MLLRTSRWLKRIISALFILTLCYIGAFATLYQVSDFASLQHQSQHIFQPNHHRLSFSQQIERRLFPRPTIILHDVKLYKEEAKTPLLTAKEMRVGMAWQSLWNKKTIEKLVIIELSGSIYREHEQQWNIADFLLNTTSNQITLNRIQLRNSSVTLKIDQENFLFRQLNLNAKRHQQNYVFDLNSQVQHALWNNLNLAIQGEAQWQDQQLHLPIFNAQFQGTEQDYPFSGSLKTTAVINPDYFVASDNVLNFNSERFDTNINANIDNIDNRHQQVNFNVINSNYTLHNEQHHYTGSASTPRAQWLNQAISSENLTLSFNHDDPNRNKFNITFHGGGVWRMGEGLLLPDVEIISQQTTYTNKIRFAINAKGQLRLYHTDHWQLQAEGSFDKQPISLKLQRQNKLISGDVVLDKLDLKNYLPEQSSLNQYPTWPERDLAFQLHLNLGTVKLPSLEINDLISTMHANAEQTEFNPLSVKLYGGSSTGYLRFENQLPLKISAQQNSQNVAIEPLMNDLFNIHSLSGIGQVNLDLHTQGNNRQEMLQQLSGSLNLNINQGQWHGINFAQLFKATFGNNTLFNTTAPFTPFKQLQLDSHIQNGISDYHIQADILEPVAHLVSQGQTNLATGEINDDVVIHGKNSAPLPIRLSGNIEHPNITLNYQKLTEGNASTEEKQKAISEALKQQWQWLKR